MKFGETWYLPSPDDRPGIWVDKHPYSKSSRCDIDRSHIVEPDDTRAWIEDDSGAVTVASKRDRPRIYVCIGCAMTLGAPTPPTEPLYTGSLFDA